MPERIDLDHRRALLAARQLLGATGRRDRDVPGVVDALALLHSTDPVTPYLSIQARSDASVDDVDDALYGSRSLSRFTTIRRTVFAMDRGAAGAAFGAYNGALADRLRTQLVTWLDSSDEVDEPAAGFLERAERRVIDHLRDAGPSTGNELSSAIDELRVRFDPQPGASYSKPIRATSKVLELLGVEVRIARDRPTGADYTSGAWRWAAPSGADERIVDATVTEEDALAALLDRYLRSFGPSTVTDMTWWTGLTKTKVRAALSELDAVSVEVDGDEPAFVLPGDDPAAVAAEESEPSIALLPGLDSTTMGWKQRDWYVDDRAQVGVFDRNGNGGPTIWWGGRVVGVWTQRADGSIATDVFEPLDSTATDRLAEEIVRLEAWLGDVRVKWRYPTPRTKALTA